MALSPEDFARARAHMVETQIARRGVKSELVLRAMRQVPREAFVAEGYEEFAYDDAPLPIGEGQTISQPYIVALMVSAAAVAPGDKVLEVGAGSGYAAAVLGSIASRVIAVERTPDLATGAIRRLSRLGYGNVEVRVGDGSKGCSADAPFDVILVSASGPSVPEALKAQLAVGGRLVIPVGVEGSQRLLKLTRCSPTRFATEDLGAVSFVPLIGEQGWHNTGAGRRPSEETHRPSSLPRMIADAAEPLPEPDDPAFGRCFDRFAERQIVLLGEASHGTAEFYRARAAITRHLVAEHGFSIVAIEADWPDAAVIDRHVRGRPPPDGSELPFQRFPTWMWRNLEFERFVAWLKEHNAPIAPQRRAGVYGLDIYNLNGSIAAVLDYLDRVDPEAAGVARERYGCLSPWQREPEGYGRSALSTGYPTCEAAVVAQCRDLLQRRLDYAAQDHELFFDAAQNARLVASAERYYRSMYYAGPESWNLRDTAMFGTLRRLVEMRGEGAKAVVWAHNSHIGDARATEMGIVQGQLNLGQLCREHFGAKAALIGFGTHGGTVAAASSWGGEMEIKPITPSRPDSYERLCHESGASRFLLDFDRAEALRPHLLPSRRERFIGVIYRPDTELLSHYAEASLPQQFDAFVWFDETAALTPLGAGRPRPGAPETFPFGL